MNYTDEELVERGFPAGFHQKVYDAIQHMNDACAEVMSQEDLDIVDMLIGVGRHHEENWDPADLQSQFVEGDDDEN